MWRTCSARRNNDSARFLTGVVLESGTPQQKLSQELAKHGGQIIFTGRGHETIVERGKTQAGFEHAPPQAIHGKAVRLFLPQEGFEREMGPRRVFNAVSVSPRRSSACLNPFMRWNFRAGFFSSMHA